MNWGLLLNPRVWLVIGFAGQALFTARMLVQWIASERKRDTVVPLAFWWLSLSGGLLLLSYATYKRDPVIIVGQATGVFVYVRNLMLANQGRRRAAHVESVPSPHVSVGGRVEVKDDVSKRA